MTSMIPHLAEQRAKTQARHAELETNAAYGKIVELPEALISRLGEPGTTPIAMPLPEKLVVVMDEIADTTSSTVRARSYSISVDSLAYAEIAKPFLDRKWTPLEGSAGFWAVLHFNDSDYTPTGKPTRHLGLFFPSSNGHSIIHLCAANAAPCLRGRGESARLGWRDTPGALDPNFVVVALQDVRLVGALSDDLAHRASVALAAFGNDTRRLPPLVEILEDPIRRSLLMLRREAGARHGEREASFRNIVNGLHEPEHATRAERQRGAQIEATEGLCENMDYFLADANDDPDSGAEASTGAPG